MSSAIHFFHANGFPVETYTELLNNLDGQVVPPISILGEDVNTVDEGILINKITFLARV